MSLTSAVAVLQQAANLNPDAAGILGRFQTRAGQIEKYIAAYRRYCWKIESIKDLRLAPFHLLATEGKTKQ